MAIAGAIFVGLGGAAAGNFIVTRTNSVQLPMYQHTFDTAFRAAFIACATIAAIGIFASLVRGKEERR